MKFYYQFKAIITGARNVGKKSLLKALDPQTDNISIQLQDKVQETLFIYEFQQDDSYIPDALCFLIVSDQQSQSINQAKQKIQAILRQLNRSYQFLVFVQNKSDQQIQVMDELESYCAQNQINFISVSAKLGTNIILLQNLLRIKAQIIMQKCQISPFPLESNREKEFESLSSKTPDRPLPKTPKSSDDKENQSDYKSIKSETVESFRAFQLMDEKQNDTQNTISQSHIQQSSCLQSTKRGYLDLNSSCRLRSPITKKLMCLEIELNNQTYKIDIYQEDSYSLIVERFCQGLQKKIKQSTKRNLMLLIETHVNSFMNQLIQQFQDKRYLRVKECYEKYIQLHNSKQVTCNVVKNWNNPQNSIGMIVLVIQQQLIKIYVHKNDEPYDLAFNSIVEFGLKKSCIAVLVNKIKLIQTQKNIQLLGFFDFTQQEFIVYNGELVQKKLYQFFMQFKLDYEYYRLLQSIQ